jgi:hypothetical protein
VAAGPVGDQTAWLRMQSEAKRSRGRFSLQFAICREIFRNCTESRSIVCEISTWFQYVVRSSPYLGSREHFSVFAGKSSVELRMVAGLAQIPLCARRPDNSIGSQADVEDRKQAR